MSQNFHLKHTESSEIKKHCLYFAGKIHWSCFRTNSLYILFFCLRRCAAWGKLFQFLLFLQK